MTPQAGNESYVDDRYPLSPLTSKIIAAAQEVHHTLGPGFEEVIHQRCLQKEFAARGLEFGREVWITVWYKGGKVGAKRVDFIVTDRSGAVMVEIKAKTQLEDVALIQTLSYLKASGCRVGLLLNFGTAVLGIKRLVN